MEIKMNEEYTTSDGKEVRIYAIDGGGRYPIHGAVCDSCDWTAQEWTSEGKFHSGSTSQDDWDLVVPIKNIWVNLFMDGSSSSYKTEALARQATVFPDTRVAVEFKEVE